MNRPAGLIRGDAPAGPANDCATVKSEARYIGYGYYHVVILKNGCKEIAAGLTRQFAANLQTRITEREGAAPDPGDGSQSAGSAAPLDAGGRERDPRSAPPRPPARHAPAPVRTRAPATGAPTEPPPRSRASGGRYAPSCLSS